MTNKFFSMTVAEMRELVFGSNREDIAAMNTEVSRRIAKRKANGKSVPNRLIQLLTEIEEMEAENGVVFTLNI